MDTQEQRNERMDALGRPGMPMVWIVLVVIGMVLLVGWLALGFGRSDGDGVTDPMTPVPATPQGTPQGAPGTVPPSTPTESDPLPQQDPLPEPQPEPQPDPNPIPPTT